MPIIVPIEENKVGPATATDAKFRAPDTSGSGLEAFGAGLIQLGGGGQQLASGIEERRRRAAEAIAATMLDDRHQSNIDDAAAKQAYVDYSDPTHEALHGDDGLFNQQGADVHTAFPGLVEKLIDNHDKSLSKLDDVQRAVVAPAMNERLRNDVDRAAHYVRQQGVAEQKWQSEQLQKVAARDAVNHADDPDLFDHHLATGEKTIRQQAKIDKVGGKLLDKQLADYKSRVHADTIDALTQRDPVHAAGWHARYGDALNQRDKLRVEAKLGPALADARAVADVDAASDTSDPTSAPANPHADNDVTLLLKMQGITPMMDQTALPALMQRYGNDPAKAWAAFEAGPETIDRLVAQRGDDWYGGLGDDTRRFVDGNMRMLGTVRSQHSAPNDIRALSAVALAQTPNAAQSTIMPASVIRLVGTPSSNTGGMDWEPSLRGGPDVQESGADNFAADGVTPKRRTAPGTAGNQRNGAQQQIPIIADDVLKGISAGSASPDRQASNRAQAEADLDNPVVVTLLQMIAYYEGPDRANGYAQIQGKLKPTDPKITDFTRYPDIGDIAAGRYQIERKNMYTTGVRNLGITSFNPNDQDMMAAFVLRHYGIIDKIEAGDFAGAMPKLANFWRALPLPGVASGVSGDARGNFTTFVKIFKELYPLVQADMNRRVLDRGQFRYVGEALRTVSPDFGAIDDSMNKNSNYVSILDKYHIFK